MDMIARKKKIMMAMLGSVLPPVYKQIKYLENNGTQYIFTDYVPTEDANVYCEYMFTASYTGDKMIFGSTTTNGSDRYSFYAEPYGRLRWYASLLGYSTRNVLPSVGNELNVKHSLSLTKNVLIVDGESSNLSLEYTGDDLPAMGLFCWKSGNVASNIHTGLRIYKFTITENGSKVADYIPCIRKSDSEPGMYETVAGKFFTNAGTGSFIIPS